MNRQMNFRRVVSAFLVVLLTAMLIVPTTLPVSAANNRFITEMCVAAGEDAVDTLEADGWSVTMVGLNVTSDPASQVYLAYKMNTGSPITGIVVSSEGGSCTDKNGITYSCVSDVDLDAGIGGGTGCLYATHDERAGSPLVGLDVLRGSKGEGEELYPITNDGAEIVRTKDGAPADLERASNTNVVYLAQIRDGIVRPYISEIGAITDTDKWNAVYTAAERGYNYYVEGDIDDSSEKYTSIGFERTADPKEAVTNITAVSAKTVQTLEEKKIVDESANQSGQATAATISISGSEYVRISSQPIEGEEPYYIYRTKDTKAGNPISMLYAEKQEQTQNFLFGTWVNGYFFSSGVTAAYTYSMNEDLYLTLPEDKTVMTKLPVQLLDDYAPGNIPVETTAEPVIEETAAPDVETEPPTEAPTEAVQEEAQGEVQDDSQENAEEITDTVDEEVITEAVTEEPTPAPTEPETEAPTEPETSVKTIKLAMLTPRDGLPDTSASLTGMRGDPMTPYVERTERSDRVNKYQASVFGKGGIIALIIGGVVIIAAAVYAVIRKKRSAKKETKESNNTNKSKRTNKTNKSKKASKSKKQNKTKKSR